MHQEVEHKSGRDVEAPLHQRRAPVAVGADLLVELAANQHRAVEEEAEGHKHDDAGGHGGHEECDRAVLEEGTALDPGDGKQREATRESRGEVTVGDQLVGVIAAADEAEEQHRAHEQRLGERPKDDADQEGGAKVLARVASDHAVDQQPAREEVGRLECRHGHVVLHEARKVVHAAEQKVIAHQQGEQHQHHPDRGPDGEVPRVRAHVAIVALDDAADDQPAAEGEGREGAAERVVGGVGEALLQLPRLRQPIARADPREEERIASAHEQQQREQIDEHAPLEDVGHGHRAKQLHVVGLVLRVG
mmetsp:Transcript_31007/g.72056  ORF Transcript_31007/g.72056 Transcript_31007/m.72056 type:complete len:305 (+) Transcript_31007:600-1514(+)